MTKDELLEHLPMCKNCIYFYSDYHERAQGLCCRHAPPAMTVDVKKNSDIKPGRIVFLHHPVMKDQFCGEGVRDPRRFGPCENCRHYDRNGEIDGLKLPSLMCKKGQCNPRSCQEFESNEDKE